MAKKSEIKEAFLLKKKYWDLIQRWTIEQKAELIDAMFKFQNGEEYEIKSERVEDMMVTITSYRKENADKYDEKCEKNRQIALERWKNANVCERIQTDTNGYQSVPKCTKSTDIDIDKDNIIKKEINKEKKKFMDYVYLSDSEYQKLTDRYGDKVITDYIEKLNNWIGEKPNEKKRQNRNAYYTILNRLKNANIKELPQRTETTKPKLNKYEIEEGVYDLDKLLPTSKDDLPF